MRVGRIVDVMGALLIAGLFGAAAVYGLEFAQFARVFDRLIEERRGERPVEAMGFWRKPPEVKPTLEPWTSADGMGGAARRLIALDTDTPGNAALRLVDVTKALAGEPTSGWLWLEYSVQCLKLPFCAPHADGARSMIEITARREGLIMLEEALMSIEYWERMPASAKARAVASLVEIIPRAGSVGSTRLKAAVMSKAPEAQTEIRAMVLARVNNDPVWQRRLGLS